LTGSDAVCDAFFRQKGIIRAHDIEDMIDIAALMQKIPALPEGKGIGLITTSGGGGILMADEASDIKLDIPELDPETRKILMEFIPPYGSALNPVDVTAQVINKAENFLKVLHLILAKPEIHALVIVITQITGAQGRQMAEDIVKISKLTLKPITVAWTTGDLLVGDNLNILTEGGIQYYKSPVRAVRAMGALMKYNVFRKEALLRPGIDLQDSKIGKIHESAISFLADKQRNLTEYEGKKLLALYGIPVTKEEIASSGKEAVSIAETIGYPVALKINSPDILHKTEAGGLRLHIKNNEELLAAYDEILINARKYNPEAQLNGILVQEMVSGGIEVIIGVIDNPQFGPTLLFGLGGIFVEILKDVSMRVAPLSFEDAMQMIKEIKGFKVLTGARGRAKADIHAIAGVLVRVSQMALGLEDQLAELDINPLLVMPEGKGVYVADALVLKKQ
ncbi:MAG: acetate--CoA ligase family protein, partial [Bacteroidia bacterium]|nr:acetate--CoA ligase family protein [Bacteroidia bacterium]